MTRYEISHRFYVRNKNKYRQYFQKNRKRIEAYHRRYWRKHHTYLLKRQRERRAKYKRVNQEALRKARALLN